MSEYRGYEGKSLEFLKSNSIIVGDSVKILTDITYSGIIMPRYEHSDDQHIVIKLNSGYNIGLEIAKIEKIEKNQTSENIIQTSEQITKKEGLPKIFLYDCWFVFNPFPFVFSVFFFPSLTSFRISDFRVRFSEFSSMHTTLLQI